MTLEIGKFIIENKLGEGNFGVVYGGKCTETGKKVAIKIEKEQYIQTSLLKHEAKVLLALKGCSGVPSLLGYGLFQKHRYIVIPLFDNSLCDRIKDNGKMAGLQCLLIRSQLKDILKSIHKRGFIHRDVKPDNIMFSGNNIYLIDYGCATNYKNKIACKTTSKNNIQTKSYVGTYEFLGELGKKGYICCDVDYEGLEKTIEACM